MESALRPSLPTATRADPHEPKTSSHFAEAQIHARLTNPAKQNIITSIRGSKRQVADIKSESVAGFLLECLRVQIGPAAQEPTAGDEAGPI